MKSLKILIVLPSLAGGGAEKVILSLIENLDTAQCKPILVIQNKIGPLKTKLNKNNIIDLKCKNFRYAIPRLITTIMKIKPDIIISTFPHITLPLVILKKYFYRDAKIIAREPNMIDASLSNSAYPRLLKFLYKQFMPKVNKIIVTSRAMKNDLIKKGINKNKLFLIHNPVDNNIRNVKVINRFIGNGLRLVMVGRLTYQKGIDRVLPMLKNINNCHLTILGDGYEKEKLEKTILKLGIEKKVKFIGFSAIANSYIAGADYLLLPSRWEGLPNVVLESLFLGTPVISFKQIVALNDFMPIVADNNLRLCRNEYEMEELLKSLKNRKDFVLPIVRENLLKKIDNPKSYAQNIEKMIKELIIAG
jgi:glycosyltransferase involved in cell wall biosynthesis